MHRVFRLATAASLLSAAAATSASAATTVSTLAAASWTTGEVLQRCRAVVETESAD